MKKILLAIVIIAIVAGLGYVGSFSYGYLQSKNSPKFTEIPSQSSISTTTPDLSSATSSQTVALSVDTSSWKAYSNNELGFGLKYPTDLIVDDSGAALKLTFPKGSYFHWPLEDDAKLTVSASSSCAKNSVGENLNSQPTTLDIGGQSFIVTQGADAAAGNIYGETVYSIHGNNVCYSLIFDTHGANGAGLYVDDPALIKQYDGQHATDLASIKNIVYSIAGSFQILSTPNGKPEDSR